MTDTFRYDNLSCYGPTHVKTPRLDQFAQRAYAFDNAYLGSFPTMPNRLDIVSGRFSFIDHEWCPLPKETVTLQQVLAASGVVTQMIADNPHLLEAGFNYDRGFQGFEWIRGQELDTWRTAPKHVNLPADGSKYRRPNLILPIYLRNTAWWQSEEDRFVARTIRIACQWLEESSRKRLRRLERDRREGVAEMILESISGLNSNAYPVDLNNEADEAELLHQAQALEETAARFYQDAAAKMPVRDVARSLTRMAQEHEKRTAELEKIGQQA